jgi:hypothetical protein
LAFGKEPVAVAFLRQSEGGVGILEGLATNPDASGSDRNNAIDCLIEMIVLAAEKLEIRYLLSYSRDKSTLERSKKHGFDVVPQTLIVKDLLKPSIRQ